MFLRELDIQLDKITNFFHEKSSEILQDASTLRQQFDEFGIPFSNSNPDTAEGPHDLKRLDSILCGDPSLSQATTEFIEGATENEESIHPCLQKSHTHHTVRPPTDDHSEKAYKRRSNSVGILPHRPSIHERVPLRRRSTTVKDQIEQHFWQGFGRHQAPRFDDDDDLATFNRYYNFRARCAATFIALSELKDYVDINRTGFDKILKKWDKVTDSDLRKTYYEKMVTTSDPFLPAQHVELERAMVAVRDMYAAVFTNGDQHAATGELKLHMRDHIQFERTTVWKDLVSKERLTFDAHAADVQPGYKLPWGWFVSKSALRRLGFMVIAVIPFAVFMSIDVFDDVPATKCLGLLLFAAIMWALEVSNWAEVKDQGRLTKSWWGG